MVNGVVIWPGPWEINPGTPVTPWIIFFRLFFWDYFPMMGLGGRSTDDTWINFPTSYNIQLLLKIYQNPFYVFQNCFIPCDSQASMMLLWILR